MLIKNQRELRKSTIVARIRERQEAQERRENAEKWSKGGPVISISAESIEWYLDNSKGGFRPEFSRGTVC